MKLLAAIIGEGNERGSGGYTSYFSGVGAPVTEPISPNGSTNSAWPYLAKFAGARGDWIDFRNHARDITSLCDSWVGRARNYAISMKVVHGSYVITGGSIYKAVGAYGIVYTLDVAPSVGVGTSGLTSWTNLGAITAEDVDGAIYTENSIRFDPNSLIHTLLNDISPKTGYDNKSVFISMGKTDYSLTSTATQFSNAIQSISNYFSRRRIFIFIGFTNYSNIAVQDAYFTGTLLPARTSALMALSSNNYVKSGADIRTYLGVISDYPALTSGTLVGLQSGNISLNGQGNYYSARAWDDALTGVSYNPTASTLGISASGISFIKDGVSFTGHGVNHFSLFQEEITNIGAGGNYAVDIPAIKAHHIPFIQTSFAPYTSALWVSEWVNNRSAYLKTLDKIVKCAEDNNIGLSVYLTVGMTQIHKALYAINATQEVPKDLALITSKSWQFLQEFITTIVNRYKDSSAIYLWQIGDEEQYHLGCEFGASWAVDGTFAAWLNWGTRPWGGNYAASDKMTISQWRTFSTNVVNLIKSLDDHNRVVGGGAAEPAPFAVNAITSGSTTSDTLAQRQSYSGTNYNEYRDYAFDIHTVNMFPQSTSNLTSYLSNEQTGGGLIGYNKGFADQVGKPYYCGSWGAAYLQSADGISTDASSELANFNDLLNSIVSNKVKMSCLWVYDGITASLPWMEFNLTSAQKQYQLSAIEAINITLGH